jgi:ATP-dependent Clp protease ATP-binding subunit ClpA
VLNLFLQAFDEGWLTDGHGRRVYLSDALIIMTSNVGSGRFQALQRPLGFAKGRAATSEARRRVGRDVEQWLSPELRNRIDEVVVFRALEEREVRLIASRYVEELCDTLRRSNRSLVVDTDVLDRLVVEGYSPAYGVRHLKRVIDDRIKLPLTQQWSEGTKFRARVRAGRIVVESCELRLAEAAGTDAVAV